MACLLAGCAFAALGCRHRSKLAPPPPAAPVAAKPARPPIPTRAALPALAAGETYAYERGAARKLTMEAARAAGLLDVDLGDDWAPYILQDGGGEADAAKPNDYRETFVALANDKLSADGRQSTSAGDQNFLEVFGIPPTLSVLAARVEADVAPAREACYDAVDRQGLEQFTGEVGFLDRDCSKRDYEQALHDADWIAKETAARSAGVSVDARGGAGAAARRSQGARARRSLPARQDAGAGGAGGAGAAALRRAALAQEPLHARRATICRRTRRWRPGNGRTTSSAGDFWAARRWGCCWRRRARCCWTTCGACWPSGSPTRRGSSRTAPSIRRASATRRPGVTLRARPIRCPISIDDHVNALLTAIGVQTPEQAIAFLARAQGGPLRAARRVQGAAASGVLQRRQEHGSRAPRSTAATSGTTCRSMGAASRWCSGAITTRT